VRNIFSAPTRPILPITVDKSPCHSQSNREWGDQLPRRIGRRCASLSASICIGQLAEGCLTVFPSRGYHRIERGCGSFVRAFTLPDSVDVDKVKAEYKSGVLAVTLSKKEVAKPKTIRVEINNN
jgi:hypothetical protein